MFFHIYYLLCTFRTMLVITPAVLSVTYTDYMALAGFKQMVKPVRGKPSHNSQF